MLVAASLNVKMHSGTLQLRKNVLNANHQYYYIEPLKKMVSKKHALIQSVIMPCLGTVVLKLVKVNN